MKSNVACALPAPSTDIDRDRQKSFSDFTKSTLHYFNVILLFRYIHRDLGAMENAMEDGNRVSSVYLVFARRLKIRKKKRVSKSCSKSFSAIATDLMPSFSSIER